MCSLAEMIKADIMMRERARVKGVAGKNSSRMLFLVLWVPH